MTVLPDNTLRPFLQGMNYLFLLLLILSIPSVESPKFIFWGLFIVSSFFSSRNGFRNILQDWDLLDSMIIVWMFSGLVVAYFAGIHHKEWGGATDTIIFTSVLLILRHRYFRDDQLSFIYYTIVLSTLIASLLATWQLYNLDNKEFLEFHSVGHVNHTAIYLALSLAVITAIIYARWQSLGRGERLFHLLVYTTIALSLVLTDSRAAIVAIFLVLLCCLLLYRKYLALSFALLSILVALIVGNYALNRGGVIEKQLDQVERGIFFQARADIWRSAYLTWQQYPLFGVGIKNYDRVTLEQLMQWCAQTRTDCNEDDYMPYAHGHNLYLNTLAERGVFGFLVQMITILALSYLVYKYRPGSKDSEQYRMIWIGAFATILLNLSIGVFNTTLHHEHAILSAILLGLLLGSIHRTKTSQLPR